MLSVPEQPPDESVPPAGRESAPEAFRPTGWVLLDNLLLATLDHHHHVRASDGQSARIVFEAPKDTAAGSPAAGIDVLFGGDACKESAPMVGPG
ncbi:hypothetical protein [Kitasatospora sp. NPDC057223]|uniref:hypothetical protein n=1 Tax=Kitasatospora sp. NPDC057223 TaxID=3346055 RepID=UPI003633618A